jgi:hypothetical protein
MSIQSIRESPDALTLRHFPILSWSFIAVSIYGLSSIVAAMIAGRQPANSGSFIALALLGGLTLFVALSGGGVNTARFDRRAGTLLLRSYGLLGRRAQERRLDEIVRLQVRVLRRSQHRVELQMRSGERLPLTSHYVVTFGSGGITRLSAYLGLEVEILSAQDGQAARPK